MSIEIVETYVDDTATSDKYSTWSLIDWGEVEEFVRSMQIKIADATKSSDWRRVNRLQYKLTHSFRAKLLAVKVVTSNKGKNTPGIDNAIWNTDARKLAGALSLNRIGYKPSPLRRVEIPKQNGKTRPLGIPTMRDRAMQCLYKLALEPVAEVLADKDSYGFRPKRSCQDAREQCFNIFKLKTSATWILEGDIEKCFDTISHEWLMQNVHMDKGILDMWLKAGFVWNGELFPTDEGTPQGGIMSPILANLALDGIEDLLNAKFGEGRKGRRRHLLLHFVRYADDFIISCSDKEVLEKEVKPLLKEFLEERGLKLSEEKTKITHIDEGFDFLGFNIRKYKGKLLIKPAKKSVLRFLKEVKAIFDSNKSLIQGELITLLNVKIRGWCNCYKGSVASQTFSYVRFRVWKMCWNWSVRRHPNKGKRWVRARYFIKFKGDDWRFADIKNAPERYLINPGSIHIKRHIKLPKDAEVYSHDWNVYLENRAERDD
jgi:RNA-directed DNA polymerase